MKRYKLRIPAPAGKLETVIDDPEGERRGLLLVAHPHPLHGGTLDAALAWAERVSTLQLQEVGGK